MTDFVTTNTTPAAPDAPGLVSVAWSMGTNQDFSNEMRAKTPPSTPADASGGNKRPTLGLVFPH